ncbi:hypothetical protein ACOME3_006560 [Neoechinorhynchus agilis]
MGRKSKTMNSRYYMKIPGNKLDELSNRAEIEAASSVCTNHGSALSTEQRIKAIETKGFYQEAYKTVNKKQTIVPEGNINAVYENNLRLMPNAIAGPLIYEKGPAERLANWKRALTYFVQRSTCES